jgi:hypothetical protein
MKKQFALLAAVCIFVGFKKVSDTLTDLGTTIAEVKAKTLEQIGNKSFNLPYYTNAMKDACRKLPVGVREATMMSLGKIIRDYVESPQFKTEYYAYAESHASMTKFDSADAKWTEEKKQKTEEVTTLLKNPQMMDIFANQMDAQLQVAESMITLLKTNPTMDMGGLTIKDFQKNADDAKMLKALYAKDKAAFGKKYAEVTTDAQIHSEMLAEKQHQANDEKNLAEIKNYPVIVKNELQQFLDGSVNIDFNAKLVAKGDRLVFVNPEYEQKDGNWKFYYRCGKESVTGARHFAEGWLSNLH